MLVCFNDNTLEVKPIHIDGILSEKVSSVNLLGLRIADDITRSRYEDTMIKGVQGCMYSLNLLQRFKVSGMDIIHISSVLKFSPSLSMWLQSGTPALLWN